MSSRDRSAGRTPARRKKRAYKGKRFPKDRDWIERRGRRKKGETKAEISRTLRKHIRAALFHIDTFNRIGLAPARREHLSKAIEFLEKALGIRPGQHLLRKQHELCVEKLKAIFDGRRGGTIEAVLQDPGEK